jgi:hypothetical protein
MIGRNFFLHLASLFLPVSRAPALYVLPQPTIAKEDRRSSPSVSVWDLRGILCVWDTNSVGSALLRHPGSGREAVRRRVMAEARALLGGLGEVMLEACCRTRM